MLVVTIIMETIRTLDREKKIKLKKVCDEVSSQKNLDSLERQKAKNEQTNHERVASVTNFKFKDDKHIIWLIEWYEERVGKDVDEKQG
jgi:hypothetical protein